MKLLTICLLALFLQGCPSAVIPIAASTGVAAIKYKWHKDEVVRTEAFRKAVLDGFNEIKQKLEDSIERRSMRSWDDS